MDAVITRMLQSNATIQQCNDITTGMLRCLVGTVLCTCVRTEYRASGGIGLKYMLYHSLFDSFCKIID